jgi:hypothetical protein
MRTVDFGGKPFGTKIKLTKSEYFIDPQKPLHKPLTIVQAPGFNHYV